MELSEKSRTFLENLRLYLVTSGKKEEEIEDIISELEDHLSEAEKEGKNVDDIVGRSPKEYMKSLADELPIDPKGILKYGFLILLGASAYILLGDVIRGGIEYSMLEMIGYPFVVLFYIGVIAVTFRHIASSQADKVKQWGLYSLLGVTPIALFLGIMYLSENFTMPMIKLNDVGNTIVAALSIAVFLFITIWTRSYISIVVPIILFVPELLLKWSGLPEKTQLISSSIIMFVGIGVLLFFEWKKLNRTARKVG
ncbi:HAAS domain-containing protein [Pseudalkalibacillus sp. SCS-8]|uniref:HAAS domain-containing protein n=1 Tax=Pseudalkalibacillus nanhaiensis TaxID=3115291 RepID=UPI0032DB1FFE